MAGAAVPRPIVKYRVASAGPACLPTCSFHCLPASSGARSERGRAAGPDEDAAGTRDTRFLSARLLAPSVRRDATAPRCLAVHDAGSDDTYYVLGGASGAYGGRELSGACPYGIDASSWTNAQLSIPSILSKPNNMSKGQS